MKAKRFFSSIVPAVLLSLSVGSIYAFSLFVDPVCALSDVTRAQVQFAFSLGIFFLGMGAAFFGPIVERNIRFATFFGTAIFILGLCVAQIAANIGNIWLFYLGYGVLVGSGTGIIYISPVKTMMQWFKNNPGIASAISIISFGFGSSLCGVLFRFLHPIFGNSGLFYGLAIVYLLMMSIGSILLKKPTREDSNVVIINAERVDRVDMILHDHWFQKAWLFMFINISAGLTLIGSAAMILSEYKYSKELIVAIVVVMGITNTSGRFLFAWMCDHLKKRLSSWSMVSMISVGIILVGLGFLPTTPLVIALVVIPALYGAGFSTCPTVLMEHYGMSRISTIHGLVLSAWGFAGLVGNQISMTIYSFIGNYSILPYVLIAMYSILFFDVWRLKRQH